MGTVYFPVALIAASAALALADVNIWFSNVLTEGSEHLLARL